MMSVSLLGLIAFQWYWIDTVIRANDDRFKKDVTAALSNVVRKLERQEAMYVVNQKILHPQNIRQIPSGSIQRVDFQSVDGSYYYQFNGGVDTAGISVFFSMDGSGQVEFSASAGPGLSTDQRGMHTNREILAKEELQDRIRRVSNKSEMVVTVLEDLMVPRRAGSRFNPQLLDSLLENELKDQGINIHYHYGVIKPQEARFAVLNDPSQMEELANSEFKANLFPNDLIADPSILSVHFPGKSDYLLSKIWVTMSSSGALILIILLCFGYAIYTIVRQKNLSEMRSDFINNMTHEFKTPIATIGLAAEALQDKAIAQVDTMRDRYIGVIGEENRRLGSQVEKVLQMSLIDKNELKLTIEDVDLHELITTAVSRISIQIENSHGSIQTVLNATESIVRADVSHLLNVILNLLDNAIKYSEDGPNILVRTQKTGNYIMFSIKDHGVGMSKEEVKHIFQRFYRVPTGNLHNVKGFGLGLAYVKSIVEMLDGSIDVESELNNGTNFIIKLPLSDG